MPSSVGKLPLAIAVAQLASLSCDIDPDELEDAAARSDPILGSTFRWLLDRLQTGEVMAWSRPLGGGLPQHLPVDYWQIDDPSARFITSQLNVKAPFERDAAPDSWLFIDEEDFVSLWNLVVAAAEQQDELRRSLPRMARKAGTGPGQAPSRDARADEQMLSIDEVIAKVRLSRGAIYARITERRFPPPVKIGRSSRWLQSELDDWIAAFRQS